MTTDRQSTHSLPATAGEATDTTPLLMHESRPLKRGNSWSSNFGENVKKVASYLGLADDRALLLHAYDDADDKLNLFKQTYEMEVRKVKDFYEQKTNEISQRMEVLVESVDTSGLDINKRHQQPAGGIVDAMTQKFEGLLQGLRPGRRESVSHDAVGGHPSLDVKHSESLDDDYDDIERILRGEASAEKRREKEELARKLDSIKRAITDIYRTAKLLHNYSIMNYTGFVKIAKKFDKTFPDHKGIFKGNNCDDGKQAEVLAAKLEDIYSRWFCDGDAREAQAQMLPKRNDGLLMDWTQLRLGYRLGMCSILAMWVAWDCVWGQVSKGEVSIGGRSAFPVFRACFGLLTWHWFWGVAVYVWTRYRINYIYLFVSSHWTASLQFRLSRDSLSFC